MCLASGSTTRTTAYKDLTVATTQSLLNVSVFNADCNRYLLSCPKLETVRLMRGFQVDPKLSKRKDDDGRLPIHWAASANQLDIVQLLAEQQGFEVDVQVRPGTPPWRIEDWFCYVPC